MVFVKVGFVDHAFGQSRDQRTPGSALAALAK